VFNAKSDTVNARLAHLQAQIHIMILQLAKESNFADIGAK